MRTAMLSSLFAAIVLVDTPRIGAQSAQPNSMQMSATALAISANYVVPGAEVQYRRTFNAWSLGLGLQSFYDPTTFCQTVQSCHKIGLSSVGFAEPRFIVGTFSHDRAASYLAGRVAYSFASDQNGVVFGGGGGVITNVTHSTALDLGAQIYTSGAGSGVVYQLRAGLSFGF